MQKKKSHISLWMLLAILIAGSSISAQSLVQNNGVNIYINDGAAIYINGDYLNNPGDGTISLEGELEIRGNLIHYGSTNCFTGNNGLLRLHGPANQILASSTPVHFPSLELDISGSELLLFSNIYVEKDLILTNGRVRLYGNQIELGENGSLIGENESNYIYGANGSIYTTRTLEAADLDSNNIAGLGLSIRTEVPLGMTTISRSRNDFSLYGTNSASRMYTVEAENNTGLDAELWIAYLNTELAGLITSGISLYKDLNGLAWVDANAGHNAARQYFYIGGQNSLSSYAIGQHRDSTNIKSFEANLQGSSNALLNWTSLFEVDNAGFVIEHSTDEISYTPLDSMSGRNYADYTNEYAYLHSNALAGWNYYRIKQINEDGSERYSVSRSVYVSGSVGIKPPLASKIKLYPNPAVSGQSIYISGIEGEAGFSLYDLSGRQLTTTLLSSQLSNAAQAIELPKLAAGLYQYAVNNNGQVLGSGLIQITE